MRKRLLLSGLALLPIIVMAILVEGFVRDVIAVPLLYIFWIARLLFESIPQLILWVVFVIAALVLASRSLITQRPMPRGRPVETSQPGRVESWARLIDLAPESDFSRWRLAQRLGQLALEVLPDPESGAAKRSVRRLEQESLDIPPQIRTYLQARMPMAKSRRGFRSSTRSPAFDLDPEQVVQFLEDTLRKSTGGSS